MVKGLLEGAPTVMRVEGEANSLIVRAGRRSERQRAPRQCAHRMDGESHKTMHLFQDQSSKHLLDGRCRRISASAVASFHPRTKACATSSRSKGSRAQAKSSARENQSPAGVRNP